MTERFTVCLSNGNQYPYQVISSKRAKHLRIKLSRKGDLSVTLPEYTKLKFAHEFIESKRLWIEKNLKTISFQEVDKLPETLNLRLLNEVWSVKYNTQASKDINLSTTKDLAIVINGDEEQIDNHRLVSKVINKWCKQKAFKIFNEMLQQQAELYGFHYHRLTIRSQKTRWGSCSQQKNINLNCKLLFMPEEVVKYVMIHELCHTIEMNHSSRFWALVEECDPLYKSHRDQLKHLGKSIYL